MTANMPAIVGIYLRLNLRRKMMVFVGLVQPIFTITLYWLNLPAALVASDTAFWFMLINASLVNGWSILVFSSLSELDRDRWTGLLAQYLTVPLPLAALIGIRTVANFAFVLLSLLVSAALAFALARPALSALASPVWLWLLAALACLALMSVLFSFGIATTPRGRAIMNFVEYPFIFLSGIGFSVALLPLPLAVLAASMPQGWLSEMLRYKAGIVATGPQALVPWLAPVLVGMAITGLGFMAYHLMQRRLQASGVRGL